MKKSRLSTHLVPSHRFTLRDHLRFSRATLSRFNQRLDDWPLGFVVVAAFLALGYVLIPIFR